MTISWLKWTMIGLVGAASMAACTVTTDDDADDDGFGGDGGEDSAGRSGSAGTSGGGSGGAGSGGGGTGGTTAGTGGEGGDAIVLTCETSGPTSDPFDSCDLTDVPMPAACRACLQSNCCSEVRNCYGTDPFNVCGYGGPEGETEYLCYRQCLEDAARDGGGSYDPEIDRPACEMACRTPAGPNGAECAAVGDYTNALALCIHDSCEDACILDPAGM